MFIIVIDSHSQITVVKVDVEYMIWNNCIFEWFGWEYLNGGGKPLFGRFGLIGGHDDEVVERLGFSVEPFGRENGAVLRYDELVVVVAAADAVHQSAVIACVGDHVNSLAQGSEKVWPAGHGPAARLTLDPYGPQ